MKKIVILAVAILVIAGVVVLYHSFEGGVTHENVGYTFSRDWLSKHNIYVFGTPPLDYLSAVNATGATWALYNQNYVDNLHNNGFKVCSGPGMISALVTDNQSLRESAHCMDINGNPAYWSSGVYSMCHNNPAWQELLKDKIEEHVDVGVDVIHIDETGAVGDLSSSGFCDYCMVGFRSYLAQRYSAVELRDNFGIDNIDSFNYRTYLQSNGAQSAWGDPNQSLLAAYFRFQYSSKSALIQELIQHAREYAGRESYSARTPMDFLWIIKSTCRI